MFYLLIITENQKYFYGLLLEQIFSIFNFFYILFNN